MKQKSVAMALAAAVAALPGMAFEFEWESRDGGAVITGCCLRSRQRGMSITTIGMMKRW